MFKENCIEENKLLEAPRYTEVPAHSLLFSELRIENTNICTYHCFFCPREKMTRKKGVMPVEDLRLVLERVGRFSGIVDLHGFGEPLWDRTLAAKIAIVSTRMPDATVRIFSTLGIKIKPATLEEILRAGLDHIEVSLYGWNESSYYKTHGSDSFKIALENLEELCRLKEKGGYHTEIVLRKFPVHPEVKQDSTDLEQEELFFQKIVAMGLTFIRERDLHNYGNGRSYNLPGRETCSVVRGYRSRILQVTWELDVLPCCFDFNGSVVFGNLREHSLQEIFNGSKYRSFISTHMNNNVEEFPVCSKCDRCFKV